MNLQTMNLQKKYLKSVNGYIKEFERRFEIDVDGWIGDIVGEIATVCDEFYSFTDIKYVIDNNIVYDWLYDWYYFTVEYPNCSYNLDSYCRLRRDAEINEYFSNDNFEKKLLYMRINKIEY